MKFVDNDFHHCRVENGVVRGCIIARLMVGANK